MNVVVASFVARLAVYPAAATGREAGVRRNSRNTQVTTQWCRYFNFRMPRQALEARGTSEGVGGWGRGGGIRVMVLAAGIDIIFVCNVEVAVGSFFRILIAAPTT